MRPWQLVAMLVVGAAMWVLIFAALRACFVSEPAIMSSQLLT